jgi:hypothetical protein
MFTSVTFWEVAAPAKLSFYLFKNFCGFLDIKQIYKVVLQSHIITTSLYYIFIEYKINNSKGA